MYLRKR